MENIKENTLPSSKQQLWDFCLEQNKPPPTYCCQKIGPRNYCAKVYIARTCGWTTGELSSTSKTAEESAATKLLHLLHHKIRF